MNLSAAVEQFWNDKQGQSMLYPPNKEEYRGQCVQPMMFYMGDYLHLPVLWYGTAAQYIKGGRGYDVIINNPNDPNQLPPRGAIIIFNSALPGSLGSGHIAAFWQNNGNHTFVSIDSNWGGKTLHMVTHNWQYVSGWLVPTPTVTLAAATTNTNSEEEMIRNETQAHQAYQLLRPNGDGNSDEIASTAGKRTWAQFASDGNNERIQRDQAFTNQTNVINQQQGTINELNSTITNLSTSTTATKQDYDVAISKVAELTVQLTTAHDQIADLQKVQSNPTASTDSSQNAQTATNATRLTLFQKVLVALFVKKKS